MSRPKRQKTVINKSKLIKASLPRTDYVRWELNIILDAIINTIKDALEAGDSVRIRHFGSFEILNRKAKRVRNLKTGDMMEVPPYQKLVFICSPELDVNSEYVPVPAKRIDDRKYNPCLRNKNDTKRTV